MTHERWVTVFPDLCELICNIILTVFLTVLFCLETFAQREYHFSASDLIEFSKIEIFSWDSKSDFTSGRCSNLESRGEESIFLKFTNLQFWPRHWNWWQEVLSTKIGSDNYIKPSVALLTVSCLKMLHSDGSYGSYGLL